jgi:hypothetical protein
MNSLIPTVTAAQVKAAVIVFVATFLAAEPASNLIGMASGSQPVDVSALRAAGVAAIAAVLAFFYHAWVGAPSTKAGA